MTKWIALVALTLALPASALAQKKNTLTPADYEEIRGLYAKYSYGFDNGDAKLVASVYTPDAQFIVGGKTVGGTRDAITAGVRPVAPGKAQMKHMPSNIAIEPSEEGATGMAYVALVTFEAGKPPAVTGGGWYHDTLVRTAEGWRFKKRDYQPFPLPVPAAPAP
ncbi:MAG: nuclear transport factor 2 family protein [Vicinamibacterales bacterium]